jgi:hypothetical protein
MLTVSQRLVSLFILYEIVIHSNGKLTSLYQVAVHLLARPINFAVKELLLTFLKSIPKISKITPKQYIEMSKGQEIDMQFFKEAYKENTLVVPLIHLSSLLNTLGDYQDTPDITNPFIDADELLPQEFLPDMYRALPSQDEFYLLQHVLYKDLRNS